MRRVPDKPDRDAPKSAIRAHRYVMRLRKQVEKQRQRGNKTKLRAKLAKLRVADLQYFAIMDQHREKQAGQAKHRKGK